jgi:hypothetical protein
MKTVSAGVTLSIHMLAKTMQTVTVKKFSKSSPSPNLFFTVIMIKFKPSNIQLMLTLLTVINS